MYQYTDCYLDNIWLINGYVLKNASGELYAVVEDVDGLHDLMMNMEVGSILNLGQSYYFLHTNSGWILDREEEESIRVA